MRRSFLGLGMIALLISSIGVAPINAQGSPKFIRDDATGGDCTQIGSWDNESKTCTFTGDFQGSLSIESNGIVLDGDGFTLSGNQTGTGVAVTSMGHREVVIKNLSIQGFMIGVQLDQGINRGTTVDNNILTGNQTGIRLIGDNHQIMRNVIINNNVGISPDFTWGSVTYANNAISSNEVGIEVKAKASGGIYLNNLFENNGVAVSVKNWMGNEFANNTIRGSRSAAIIGTASGVNRIYNNNFINNPDPQVRFGPQYPPPNTGEVNQYDLPLPIGGNYWSNWSTPDANNDGYVDAPYVLVNGQDNAPWARPSAWLMLDINALIAQTAQVCASGQIAKPSVCQSLANRLEGARKFMIVGRFDKARTKLLAFIDTLNDKSRKVIPSETYHSLKLAAENLLDRLVV